MKKRPQAECSGSKRCSQKHIKLLDGVMVKAFDYPKAHIRSGCLKN